MDAMTTHICDLGIKLLFVPVGLSSGGMFLYQPVDRRVSWRTEVSSKARVLSIGRPDWRAKGNTEASGNNPDCHFP
jgi:hypothetical protein